jgi:hypothetical protein
MLAMRNRYGKFIGPRISVPSIEIPCAPPIAARPCRVPLSRRRDGGGVRAHAGFVSRNAPALKAHGRLKEGRMNLIVWLPAMFALGLASLGVCLAFTLACEHI